MKTGRLIPALLGAIAFLIVFSGFLPLTWFRYADYEMARQVLQRDAPFIPNLHLRTSYFSPADAEAGNLRPTETLPLRTFTTDSLGFRYSPPVRADEPPTVLVMRGFSFTFGVGLSDDQTFPAVLARDLGENVYNGARFLNDPEMPADFDRLINKLQMQPKAVVYVHLEPNAHTLPPRNTSVARLGESILGPQLFESVERDVWFAHEFPLQWIRLSPAIQVSVEAKKALQNDRILTNRYRKNVITFALPDGKRLLVRTGDLERAQTDFDESVISERAAYIAWWKDQLAARGVPMTVLLVPDKMSVYGSELGVHLPSSPYLTRLEHELRARGVGVVNGLPVLREYVNADLASGRLAYLREDEHWSALGVERLAHATAEALKSDPGWVGQSASMGAQ